MTLVNPITQHENIVHLLNTAVKNAALYPHGHQYVKLPQQKSLAMVTDLLGTTDRLVVELVEGMIWIQNVPIPQHTLWDAIATAFENCGRKGVHILNGLTDGEWEGFLAFLISHQHDKTAPDGDLSAHVRFITDDDPAAALEVYSEAIDVARNVVSEIRLGRVPKVSEVRSVVDKMVDRVLKHKMTMIALTMMRSYDNYLFQHSVNVAILCLALGESIGLGPELLRELGTAAMLHDIGKIQIDPNVVLKPDRLSQEEWELMRTHPDKGYEMLSQMEGMSEVSYRVAFEHHMGYDLSGYPQVPPDYKLHQASMILSICDCYDAMTTHRIYQKSRDPKDALDKMAELAGHQLEPHLFKEFVKMLGIYPIGTLVRLSTGETGIVSFPNPATPDEPVIKIVFDVFGNKIENPWSIDLSQHPVDPSTSQPLAIAGTVNASWTDIDIAEFAKLIATRSF